MTAAHLHHRVPRCLLRSYGRACKGELDGEGLQAWFDWEEEAFRYGVDPEISRDGLAGVIEASAKPVPQRSTASTTRRQATSPPGAGRVASRP